MTDSKHVYDVVVIGGGPAGSAVATLLTQCGLRVVVFEREQFPRFHVGESLLPAILPLFDRLGCHDAIRQAGFIVKPGAVFYDEYEGRGRSSFLFQATPSQPAFTYNVERAQFDALLLQHAASVGATVHEQYTVEQAHLDADKVVVQARTPQGSLHEVTGALLVDASGRTAFLSSRFGKRQPLPDLGRASFFAHFRGARRDPEVPDGSLRIHIVRDGWLWWIPFADGTDSIGCVLHAKVVKARQGSVTDLFESAIASAPLLAQGLQGAERFTPVRTAANFSYRVTPAVGHRYVAVGDASGFIDPIFSSGVFVALHSAELAAQAIQIAFQRRDFRARRFWHYDRQLNRDRKLFRAFIHYFYDPAFLDLFFAPQPPKPLYRAVIAVLNGSAVTNRPLRLRMALRLFFLCVTGSKAIRWLRGLPNTSRWHW